MIRTEPIAGVPAFLRAARRVRLEGFDVSILFPNAFRAAFLIYAAGIPERWGYATESRGVFLTKRVAPAPRPFGRHQAHFYLDLIGGLGLDLVEPDLSLKATEEMRRGGLRSSRTGRFQRRTAHRCASRSHQ